VSKRAEADPTASLKLVDPAEGVGKVLVIAAHPDDVDFGAAGTVARMTAAGVEVAYGLVTDGDAGGSDLDTTADQRAQLRRAEQTRAAEVVGVSELHFLGHLDGSVTANLGLRRDLARLIRIVRPDRVIAQSPELWLDRIYASHPDHRASGEAALAAVYPDARNPFAFPELLDVEGLEPHVVPEVWLMASPSADIAVETTEFLSTKVAALRCHASQVGDGEHLEGLVTGWGRAMARAAGLGKKRCAEAFRRVSTA
jgi:LmbE family N-acetylglucosaminyl deacetylase